MELQREDYVSIISLFYKKVIKQHSKHRVLIDKFNDFIKTSSNNDSKKSDRKIYLGGGSRSTRTINDSSRSIGSSNSPVKNNRPEKSQKVFRVDSVLYSSTSFLKTFIFAYLHFLIQYDHVNQFQELSERTATYLEENKMFDQTALKRVNFLWTKIGQFLTKRSKIRWTFQMKESFNQFSDDFVKVLLLAIMKKKVDINSITEESTSGPNFMKDVTKLSPFNIAYFEMIDGEIENLTRIGNYKHEVVIGFDPQDKKYVLFDEVPTLKSTTNFKVDNLNKKISSTIDSLLKDYKENTDKLLALDFLKDSNSKQARIKKYLSIDK